MIDAPHWFRIPSLRLGDGALICLTRNSAYKYFWGAGARARFNHEIERTGSAQNCPVWGDHLLTVVSVPIPRLLRSARGEAIPAGGSEDSDLYSFVEQRLRDAVRQHAPLPALQVMEIEKLLIALGEQAFLSIIDPLRELLDDVWLPSGPTHGDLHRGNIVKADGHYFLIDCDSYNARSSPLFDRIHFGLTERKLTRRLKWMDLLAESEDIIVSAMDADGIVSASPAKIALAYGFNRVALEAFRDRLRGRRHPARSRQFAARLLKRYGDGAVGDAQAGYGYG